MSSTPPYQFLVNWLGYQPSWSTCRRLANPAASTFQPITKLVKRIAHSFHLRITPTNSDPPQSPRSIVRSYHKLMSRRPGRMRSDKMGIGDQQLDEGESVRPNTATGSRNCWSHLGHVAAQVDSTSHDPIQIFARKGASIDFSSMGISEVGNGRCRVEEGTNSLLHSRATCQLSRNDDQNISI